MEENTQNSENGPIPFLMSIEEPDVSPAGAAGVYLVFFAELELFFTTEEATTADGLAEVTFSHF